MKYAVVIILVFSFSVFIVPAEAVHKNNLSYVEQLKYATLAERISGHVVAGYQNLERGSHDMELAKEDLAHPLTDEFESMKYFYDDHVDFKNKLEYILFTIVNISDGSRDLFDEQAKEMLFLANQGKKLIIHDEQLSDKYFNLLTASSILESSKMELEESAEGSGVFSIIEYQDAFGFAIRAHMILNGINGLDPVFENRIHLNLDELFIAFDEKAPIPEIIGMLDTITIDIYENVIKNKPSFKEIHNTHEHVKRSLLIQQENSDGKKLISFVGDSFPENSNVVIIYYSSHSVDQVEVKAHTTSDGKFFIPVEFILEHTTYFLEVTSEGTTTNHMLST